jgi:hypothetical protein
MMMFGCTAVDTYTLGAKTSTITSLQQRVVSDVSDVTLPMDRAFKV